MQGALAGTADVVRQQVQQVGRAAPDEEHPGGLGGGGVEAFAQPVREPETERGKLHLALPGDARPHPGEQHEDAEQDRKGELDPDRSGSPREQVADETRPAVRRAGDSGGVEERNQERDPERLRDGGGQQQPGRQQGSAGRAGEQGARQPAGAGERAPRRRPGAGSLGRDGNGPAWVRSFQDRHGIELLEETIDELAGWTSDIRV